jgi:hypothetical protein
LKTLSFAFFPILKSPKVIVRREELENGLFRRIQLGEKKMKGNWISISLFSFLFPSLPNQLGVKKRNCPETRFSFSFTVFDERGTNWGKNGKDNRSY